MYINTYYNYTRCCRPERDPLASVRFAKRKRVAFVADRSINADLPDRVGRAVLPFAQHFGESPFTDLIATCRNVQVERLMRPLMVVNLPLRINLPLAGRHIRPHLTLDDLGIERPMEALVFALGLRMERSTVADAHAQLEQPDRQSRPWGLRAGRPPEWAVVAEDALRHAEAPEHRREVSLHRLAPLVGTGVKPDAMIFRMSWCRCTCLKSQ